MSEAIWKYELETTDHQTLKMPAGAQILTIQTQRGNPCLWAVVTVENEIVDRKITIRGTGHIMAMEGDYLGTYQSYGGDLVFHVFEDAS